MPKKSVSKQHNIYNSLCNKHNCCKFAERAKEKETWNFVFFLELFDRIILQSKKKKFYFIEMYLSPIINTISNFCWVVK